MNGSADTSNSGHKIKRLGCLQSLLLFLTLFLCAPIGIVIAILSPSLTGKQKVYISIIGLCWLLLAGVAPLIYEVESGGRVTPTSSVEINEEQEAKMEVEKIAKKYFPNVTEVTVSKISDGDPKGRYNIEAQFHTWGDGKKIIGYHISDFLIALFQSSVAPEIREVWCFATTTVVDQYGNKSEDVIYKVTVDRETADKINWPNMNFILLRELWKEPYIDPTLDE